MLCAMGLLNTTEDSSPCNSALMNLQNVRDRLDCVGSETAAPTRKEREGRRSERTEVRQARLDRRSTYTVRSLSHSVDPSAWS